MDFHITHYSDAPSTAYSLSTKDAQRNAKAMITELISLGTGHYGYVRYANNPDIPDGDENSVLSRRATENYPHVSISFVINPGWTLTISAITHGYDDNTNTTALATTVEDIRDFLAYVSAWTPR